MAPDKRKVKRSAALLTGIMIPQASRHWFQRPHALFDQLAALAIRPGNPTLAVLTHDQPRTGIDGPQIVDLERLRFPGDQG